MWTKQRGLPPSWENPRITKFYRDFLRGRIEIPGLKISIRDIRGNRFEVPVKQTRISLPTRKTRIAIAPANA